MQKYTAYVHLEMSPEKFGEVYTTFANLQERLDKDPNWIKRDIETKSLSDASYLTMGWAKVVEFMQQAKQTKKNEDGSFSFNEALYTPYVMLFDYQRAGFVTMMFD